MAYFRYKGRNLKGKIIQGKIKADQKKDAVEKLKKDKVALIEIDELTSILYQEINIGNKVKIKDFVIYLRQFATLIEAGISLVQTTHILQKQTDSKPLKKALEAIAEDLEAGQPFSDAAEKQKKTFPNLFINMLRAGEAGGNLDEILNKMASYYEKQFNTRQKVISALTYPVVVGVIAIGIVTFMLSTVVPQFANMFLSFGGEVPPLTQFVLNAGDFFSSFWWIILLLPILLVVLIKYSRRDDRIAYGLDVVTLRVPVFGKLLQKAALARMTQTLSSLFHSSVPILEAVHITERVVGNKVIERVLQESRRSLEKGESMAGPMEKHWIFPPLVTQMITVGEASGALDTMLLKVAEFYEAELDHATDRIKILIEPIMIVFLAVVVGGIVAAIAIPMFSIFEQIQ